MDAALLWLLATMGITGSLHCAAMCGPLALVVTGGAKRRAASLALYLTGKTSSYVLLGALAGALGEAVVKAAPLGIGGRFLALAGGALLLAVALHSLGLIRDSFAGLGWLAKVSSALATLAAEGGLPGKLLLGTANGFLPCPMTYAFLAIAAATGSTLAGAAAMLILGITTALPLAAVAYAGGSAARLRFRRLPLLGGVVMLIVAALTLYRGFTGAGPCCR
jgi:sulfite exporter TauE/SafE